LKAAFLRVEDRGLEVDAQDILDQIEDYRALFETSTSQPEASI
jgi:hypothetical protein